MKWRWYTRRNELCHFKRHSPATLITHGFNRFERLAGWPIILLNVCECKIFAFFRVWHLTHSRFLPLCMMFVQKGDQFNPNDPKLVNISIMNLVSVCMCNFKMNLSDDFGAAFFFLLLAQIHNSNTPVLLACTLIVLQSGFSYCCLLSFLVAVAVAVHFFLLTDTDVIRYILHSAYILNVHVCIHAFSLVVIIIIFAH